MPNSDMQVIFYVRMLYLKSIKQIVFAKLSPKMIKDFINDINLQYSYKIKIKIFPELIYINSAIFTITMRGNQNKYYQQIRKRE